jgi:hypothetical protein
LFDFSHKITQSKKASKAISFMTTNERFENENDTDANNITTPSCSKCNKKRTIIIAVGLLLAIAAIVVGVVIATTGVDKNAGAPETTDNVISCEMSQMESSGEELVSMAPANIDVANDMMTMDSMTFNCVAQGQDAAVYSKMSSKKVTMDSGATQTIWHGAMTTGNRLGFATLLRSNDGTMSGTFTTEDAAFSVMTDPNGNLQMKMTPWTNFPNGSAIEESASSSNTTVDTGMAMESSVVPFVLNGTMVSEEVDTVRTALTGPSRRSLRHSRKLQANTARVLLLVTNGAMCQYAGLQSGCEFTSDTSAPFGARVPLLEAEMNSAMQGVGVDAAIQIVQVMYLTAGFEGAPDQATLDLIRSDTTIAQWRSDAQADLVTMITGSNGNFCGIAYLNAPESSTRVDCLDAFTFSHELGHNYGGSHDRANSETQHPYGHGYQDPSRRLRTVMSYDCAGGGCPVVPYFSAEGYFVNDIAIGSPTENNARLLSENAAQTSQLLFFRG